MHEIDPPEKASELFPRSTEQPGPLAGQPDIVIGAHDEHGAEPPEPVDDEPVQQAEPAPPEGPRDARSSIDRIIEIGNRVLADLAREREQREQASQEANSQVAPDTEDISAATGATPPISAETAAAQETFRAELVARFG